MPSATRWNQRNTSTSTTYDSSSWNHHYLRIGRMDRGRVDWYSQGLLRTAATHGKAHHVECYHHVPPAVDRAPPAPRVLYRPHRAARTRARAGDLHEREGPGRD